MTPPGPDDTVRLPSPRRAEPSAAAAPPERGAAAAPPEPGAAAAPPLGPAPRRRWAIGAAIALLLAGAGGAWLVLSPRAPVPPEQAARPATPPPATPPAPTPPAPTSPAPAPQGPAALGPTIPLLDEATLTTLLPAEPVMVRLRENPQVFVLLFPDLEAQGEALNRLAALVEKAGLPRDRLLSDEALAAAIAATGETPGTWYYGHDYPGAEIARFLSLAERDGIRLNRSEQWVAEQFRHARALVPPEREVALISAANPDARADAAMRAAILRHEIGHGHFFTLREVAAHVLRVWREAFTEAEREAFRRFLGREGYDTGNERLMANEAMAYLVFTPDARFFAPRHVGLTEAEVARLRRLMREGAPFP